MRSIRLVSSGRGMPIVGLGTWKGNPEEMENTVDVALEVGYRHIDTVFNYNTEESIGKILKEWIGSGKVKRENLFITTKLLNYGNRSSVVERFLNLSLQKLQLDYVDLYLIHMPFGFLLNESTMSPMVKENREFCLDTAERKVQVKKGKIKSIGVSNFNAKQLKRLHENVEIKPAVLQVELHAYLQQK
ncbi:unnamed protein product [Ceutorhynchus assimilis]|uniref:NADP-dependent oxidoreductase domain-containing protein n=1 Tax=Ceutorhynchus assimilis TaxID=467358 RepID=A0A9N9MZW1_9CUCU|nr:unnamed protein product [Ceutorhynchus assimilis]